MRLFKVILSAILISLSFVYPHTNCKITQVKYAIGVWAYCLADEIEGLNKNQPISIGEVIYRTKTQERIGYSKAINYSNIEVSYSYLGIEYNNLKLDYRQTFYRNTPDPSKIEVVTLSLPLDAQRQALLRINTLNRQEPYQDLIITVMDEFNRIVVKEAEEKEALGPAGY